MAIPGVVNAGAVSRLPMTGKNLGSLAFVEGKSVPGQPGFDVEYRVATPSYFATMGIPLRAGRYFDDHDDANRRCGTADQRDDGAQILAGRETLWASG